MKLFLLATLIFVLCTVPGFSRTVTLDGGCTCVVPDGWSALADQANEVKVRDASTGRVCDLKVITLADDYNEADSRLDDFNDRLKAVGCKIISTGNFQFKGHDAFQTAATNTIGGTTIYLYSMTVIVSKKMYVLTVADASGDPQKDEDLAGFIDSLELP